MAAETGLTVSMRSLPGDPGNGFAREMNIPGKLRPAVELLCAGRKARKIDLAWLSGLGEAHVTDTVKPNALSIGASE